MNKSKVIINKHLESALFSICKETLERVEDDNYLGQVIYADPNHRKEIRRAVCMGRGAFGKHSEIMKSKLPLSLKRRLYN